MGLRGLFFLLGGTLCLLYQSPMICIIAAITMTCFNCIYYIFIGWVVFYKPRNIKLKKYK